MERIVTSITETHSSGVIYLEELKQDRAQGPFNRKNRVTYTGHKMREFVQVWCILSWSLCRYGAFYHGVLQSVISYYL